MPRQRVTIAQQPGEPSERFYARFLAVARAMWPEPAADLPEDVEPISTPDEPVPPLRIRSDDVLPPEPPRATRDQAVEHARRMGFHTAVWQDPDGTIHDVPVSTFEGSGNSEGLWAVWPRDSVILRRDDHAALVALAAEAEEAAATIEREREAHEVVLRAHVVVERDLRDTVQGLRDELARRQEGQPHD